jgi:DNA-binding CsgD family transcriptional regulator
MVDQWGKPKAYVATLRTDGAKLSIDLKRSWGLEKVLGPGAAEPRPTRHGHLALPCATSGGHGASTMWQPGAPVVPPGLRHELLACELRLRETIEQLARDHEWVAEKRQMAEVSQPPASRPVPLPPLTARERAVLQLVATGATNKQIARALGLTQGTVSNCTGRIFRKFGVGRRTTAALLYLASGDAADAVREPPRRL